MEVVRGWVGSGKGVGWKWSGGGVGVVRGWGGSGQGVGWEWSGGGVEVVKRCSGNQWSTMTNNAYLHTKHMPRTTQVLSKEDVFSSIQSMYVL